jgi:hypothetical protein
MDICAVINIDESDNKKTNLNMNMKPTISKLFMTAAMAFIAFAQSNAQSNLGASCGCPAVSARTNVINLSSLAINGGATDGELSATNTVLTCNNMYVLDKKIYVPNGKTITINPGTVIKGIPNPGGDPAQAVALVIERGGKIFASGSPDCQIVFTASADPLDGSYGVSHHGDWGGVVILGRAKNNLTLANATSTFGGTCTGATCFGTGVGTGFIEGFTAADSRNQYGGTDDDDNSGVVKYVSIRHAGAIINAANGNELNGLTLGSVGRGTTIEHVEIISSNDDGIEFFGGSVNIKYVACLFGMDDMFDWDQGWTGKAQFLFGLASDNVTTFSADNGFEADADDQKTGALPLSHPVIYNATLISNGDINQNVADNSAHAGINAKEFTQGEIYSSIFSNFETGFNMQKTAGTRASGVEAYNNWTGGSLIVSCNSFIGNVEGLKIDKSKTSDGVAPLASDNTKFTTTDNNVVGASATGYDYTYELNTSTNAVLNNNTFDAVPNPALASSCIPPADGFFNQTNYKGAFAAGQKSWLSDWAYAATLQFTAGLVPCPTDINGDGITNNVDFLQLLGQFNQSCH